MATPEATISIATAAPTEIPSPIAMPVAATPIVVTAFAVTSTPPAASTPMPTAITAAVFVTAPITFAGSILIAYGEDDLLSLAQVDSQGNVRSLAEPCPMDGHFWARPHLSPDGSRVAYFASSSPRALVVYNLQTHQEEIALPPGVHANIPVFDATGQRIAYTTVSDLHAGNTYDWAIHVRDIATGGETVFQGPTVGPGQQWHEPLPGDPLAWVGDELFLDGFVPYAETIHWGIRVLDVKGLMPGDTKALQTYDRLLLDPHVLRYWIPTLSPDGNRLAFVIWKYDHTPACYENPEGDGIAVGVGVVPTGGGPSQALVDVTGEGGVLTGDLLAWSPDGTQLLFAQPTCKETYSPEQSLQAINLKGVLTHKWPLTDANSNAGCYEALWCTSEQIFYVCEISNEPAHLMRLDVETGQSEQVLSSDQIRLIGCRPQKIGSVDHSP